MSIERKTINFEVKEINEEEGTFTGYGSAFRKTPDSYGDIVDPGAFKKTIKEGKGRIVHLFNHNVMEPIGKPDELLEDETGLFVKGRLSLGVQRAREVLALMKDGVITTMSIGYETVKEQMIDGARHLKEIKLYDVSPVVFAADNEAIILNVKNDEDEVYNCECIECGYKLESKKHCSDIKCPECGGEMRRAERPGPGKSGRVLSASNISKVRAAFAALQALLEAAEDEVEPEKSTLLAEATDEAATLEAVVNSLRAENDGFDVKQAERRIESILEQLRK